MVFLFAFACNAKRCPFAYSILLLFFFSFSSVFLGGLPKFFIHIFNLLLLKTRVTSIGHTGHTEKKNLRRYSISCHSRQVWLMACHVSWFIHGNQHSQHPNKNKKQKLRNKMEGDRRFKAQKTEKSSWWVKKSVDKEKRSSSKEEID